MDDLEHVSAEQFPPYVGGLNTGSTANRGISIPFSLLLTHRGLTTGTLSNERAVIQMNHGSES